jgi:hypothetical protein
MSFTVQKSLGNSFFRFAVGRRREFRTIDHEPELSTGPAGEFVRHRPEIFYQADLRVIHKPEIKPIRSSTTSAPFWSSVFDGTGRGYAFIAVMVFGGLLLLLGLANVANGNRAGWVLTIFGLILASIPILITGQKRRSLRQVEERKQREREDRDKRNAELLTAYTDALERLREDPSDANLDLVLRENEKLDLPYAVWADTAIGTVLYVGFSTLAKVGHQRAQEVADLMDRASDAAGLIQEDAVAVKRALYSTILWHLIADDRLGETQLEIVRSIQKGFRLGAEDVPQDMSAEAQFHRLRGIDHRNAPRCEAQIPLGLNEYCMYTAQTNPGSGPSSTIYVTSKRIVVTGDKRVEFPATKIDDILVDADRNLVTLRAAELKKPIELHVEEPLYLAALVDLAMRLDDRPKSFT